MKVRPGSMGKPFPGITGDRPRPGQERALRDPRQDRPDRAQVRLALADADLLEQRRGLSTRSSATAGTSPATGPSIDADGYFWFAGRDDDIINTAGHLVSPFEVESALLEHPAVAESAVVVQARPDQPRGRQGLRHAQAGLHGQQGPRSRDHELHPQEALAPGHAPGDRVRRRRCPRPGAARSCAGSSTPRNGARRSATRPTLEND